MSVVVCVVVVAVVGYVLRDKVKELVHKYVCKDDDKVS